MNLCFKESKQSSSPAHALLRSLACALLGETQRTSLLDLCIFQKFKSKMFQGVLQKTLPWASAGSTKESGDSIPNDTLLHCFKYSALFYSYIAREHRLQVGTLQRCCFKSSSRTGSSFSTTEKTWVCICGMEAGTPLIFLITFRLKCYICIYICIYNFLFYLLPIPFMNVHIGPREIHPPIWMYRVCVLKFHRKQQNKFIVT